MDLKLDFSKITPLIAGEGIVVALILVVIFTIIHMLAMAVFPAHAMEHSGMFAAVALTGFLTHIILEISGGNDKYCKNRMGL
jgi:uncharacterized membrane protein YhaH (DUF805 family)